MANADILISAKKAVVAFVLFGGSALLTAFIQTPEAALPLGAIAAGAWNFIKHEWLE